MNSERSSPNSQVADPADNIVQGNNEFALSLYGHVARCGASNLFFDNLKSEVARFQGRDGADYEHSLHEVWSMMHKLQK